MTSIPSISDPAAWWRVPAFATPRVAVCGDLDTEVTARGREQLDAWLEMGITDIIDVRSEWSDADFVALHAPEVRYHWLGVDDAGQRQPDEWFEAGLAAALRAIDTSSGRVLVHCHMGVNRGPSMAFAILLGLGHDPVEALRAIRSARPIAAILYAEDAISWWHRRNGTPETIAYAERRRVREWLRKNEVDVGWIISRIRRAEAS